MQREVLPPEKNNQAGRSRTVGALRAQAAARGDGVFAAKAAEAAATAKPAPTPPPNTPRTGKPSSKTSAESVAAQPGRGMLSTDVLQTLSENRTQEISAASEFPSPGRLENASDAYTSVQTLVNETVNRSLTQPQPGGNQPDASRRAALIDPAE